MQQYNTNSEDCCYHWYTLEYVFRTVCSIYPHLLFLPKDQAKKAESHLLQAVHLSPTHSPAHSELASAYTKLGLTHKAREHSQRATDLEQSLAITPKR